MCTSTLECKEAVYCIVFSVAVCLLCAFCGSQSLDLPTPSPTTTIIIPTLLNSKPNPTPPIHKSIGTNKARTAQDKHAYARQDTLRPAGCT